jgi:hypothetical protein
MIKMDDGAPDDPDYFVHVHLGAYYTEGGKDTPDIVIERNSKWI